MSLIALPHNIQFQKSEKENQGIVIVEPCYPGYGTTLGNALRRVLLSSLPGAAVIGVKIKNADHEFMAIPHVQEDILEITLNLKKLRLKTFSEEPVVLELDEHGEKKITAGMIKPNSLVEIANKDLEIATITDMAGNLNMEIYVSAGKGYETVENREKKNKEIGYIEIDSAYSPIINVSISIENVRVGKMTNWDKLILNIDTDGTINPEDAFKSAVNILIEQFSALSGNLPAESEIQAEAIAEHIAPESDIAVEIDEEDKPETDKTKKKKSPKISAKGKK